MITPDCVGLRLMKISEARLFAAWEKMDRPYPWTEDQFSQTLSSSTQQTLVWEDETGLNGFGVIQIVGDEAYLLNIMIKPEKRRRGKGAELLKKLADWSETCGACQLFLDVDPTNIPAVRLYRHNKFEVAARRVNAYPRGEESILMRRKLK